MKRTRLKRRSALLEAQMKVYRVKRARFLKEHPHCALEPFVAEAQGRAAREVPSDDVHHKMGRGKYLLDESTWEPAGRENHDYVETHKRWARGVGLIQYK